MTPNTILHDPEISLLVENQIDILAAIEAADDDDELMALHAMQHAIARRITRWLDEAEAVTRA
jgi:hypothetical protein